MKNHCIHFVSNCNTAHILPVFFKITQLFFYLCLSMLSACSQQIITRPYPIWGEEIYRYIPKRELPLPMQILSPKPPTSALGCLLIVHGMNEHTGRYGEIAEYFSDRFLVAGFDFTAHGLSNPLLKKANESILSGKNGYDASRAYQEQTQLRNLQPLRNDLKNALSTLIEHCDKHIPDNPLPVFILSHSLGSLVSASWLLQTSDTDLKQRIQGVILTGPAFSVTQVPGWRGWFQNPFVNFTFYTHEHFLNPGNESFPLLFLNQLTALITVPLQDGIIELFSLPGFRNLFSPTIPDWVADYISDWDRERDRFRSDQYIIRKSVLNYALGIEKEIIRFRSQMKHFDTPYLLIYSEHDPITPAWGNSDFLNATFINHVDNQKMLLTGENHHEQLFSRPPLKRKILKMIDHWLEKRLTGQPNN